MTQWSKSLPSCCMTFQHMASKVNVKWGESSGKAPGCSRLSKPWVFHESLSLTFIRQNWSHSQPSFKGDWKTGDQIGISTHTNSLCHKKSKPKGMPWSHYEHCANVDRTKIRFQIGWPIGLNVVSDDIWSLSWPGHSATFFCYSPPWQLPPLQNNCL